MSPQRRLEIRSLPFGAIRGDRLLLNSQSWWHRIRPLGWSGRTKSGVAELLGTPLTEATPRFLVMSARLYLLQYSY